MTNKKLTKLDQRGVVAILVSVISLVVISLITVGFAQLARREQRQALDKQLSVEAYYAAEAGVNDAIQAVDAGYGNKNNCDSSGTFEAAVDKSSTMVIDPAIVATLKAGNGQFDYTCLLIDTTPTVLTRDPVDSSNPWVVPIEPSRVISKLLISWQEPGSTTNFSGAPLPRKFPTPDGWAAPPYNSSTGVLRIDLTNLSSPQNYNGLSNNTMTFFAYPNSSGPGIEGTVAYSAGYGNKARIVDSNCNAGNTTGLTPLYCNVEVTGLPIPGFGTQKFYLRVSSLYNTSTVQVRTASDLDDFNNPISLKNAQAVIDSTGKVSDVLHRIQVRKDISSSNSIIPSAALHVLGTICKQLDTAPPPSRTVSSNTADPSCSL